MAEDLLGMTWRVAFFCVVVVSEAAMLYLLCSYLADFRWERYNRLIMPAAVLIRIVILLVGMFLGLPNILSTFCYLTVDFFCIRLIFDIRWVKGLVLCGAFYAVVTAVDLAVVTMLMLIFRLPLERILTAGPIVAVEYIVARLLVLIMVQVVPRLLYRQWFYIDGWALLRFGLTPLFSSVLVLSLLLYDDLLFKLPGIYIIFLLVWWLNIKNVSDYNAQERAQRQLLYLRAEKDSEEDMRFFEQRLSASMQELDLLAHNQKFDLPNDEELEALVSIPIYTGNVQIDPVLSRFQERATSLGIKFDASGKLPHRFIVDRRDLRVVLGNLLQNALEACQAIDSLDGRQPFIYVTVDYGPNGLFIEVVNSTNPGLPDVFPHVSSKRGASAHGYGEPTIQGIVEEKYHGSMLTRPLDDNYCVRVVLPLEVDYMEQGKQE